MSFSVTRYDGKGDQDGMSQFSLLNSTSTSRRAQILYVTYILNH